MADVPLTRRDLLTTKGDLYVHNGTDLIRVGVGTDDQVLTADAAAASGVKWAAAGGGSGSGDLTHIETVTLASDAATIDFTGIAGTYRDLLIVGRSRSARSGNAVDAQILRVGGSGGIDTGSNYSFALSGDSAERSDAAAFFNLGPTPAGTATAGRFGIYDAIRILDYAADDKRRDIITSSAFHATSSVHGINALVGQWTNTTDAITRVQLYTFNANMVAGTRFSLYGVG